jgi:hypothetical protein
MSQDLSSSNDKDSKMDPDNRAANKSGHKSTKKGQGWLLNQDVEIELDP